MNESFIELYTKFKEIKNMGWVKSQRIGVGGIGYTFEKLIGKEEDNFSIPDYEGIEIKTTNQFGNEDITLFSATPDGDYLFPIKSVLDKLGYPDKDYPEYKVFNMTVNAIEYKWIGLYKKMKLVVNRDEKKIDLIVKSRDNKPIDINVSWSIDMLRKKIYIKLRYLAIIKAKIRKVGGEQYFLYNKISLYELKSFDKFIDLIEMGVIVISFKISIFKKGPKFGKMHDRGTSFSIKEKDISYLYYDRIINWWE